MSGTAGSYDPFYKIEKVSLLPLAAAGIAMADDIESPPKANRGIPRRDKTNRKREKQHRKAKRGTITPALVELPASGRAYQQTAAGNLLRVDGKRGAKNRAKGWIT